MVVGPSAEVAFEGRSYSMPPRAAHTVGTAFVYEDRVRFVAGRFEATHGRGGRPGTRSTLPEHRAEKLREVHGARAVQYEKRQQLLDLGEDAAALLTALVHRSPTQSLEDVAMLHALYAQHGEEATRGALARVVAAGELTVDAVIERLAPEGAAAARELLRRTVERDAVRPPREPHTRAPKRARAGGAR